MKKEVKKNNSKIIFEIILIPLCFLYLFYTILNNHPKASFVVCSLIVIITCLEFAIKYLKEVYVYENKYNLLKLIFGIFSIILIIISGLNLVYSIKFLFILFIVMTFILLIFLLGFAIKNIIDINKNKGVLYKKAFSAFLSLIAFMTIFITLLIKLI
ncbi:MAG: hypothetical protein ACI31R_06435 [Bacilli bacterium]